LLLDRKRIRKWAKWVALVLAIVFAASFLFLGVGYGGAGFDLSRIFQGGCTETTVPQQVTDTELEGLKTQLAAAPQSTELMIKIAEHYKSLYSSSSPDAQNLSNAAEYYEQALKADPGLKEVYLDLAKVYLQSGSYADAARVLNAATSVDPDNPDVYYYLGRAQRDAGKKGEAILAWQKYLQLVPDGKKADSVRSELAKLMAPTTTTSLTTTTTGGATTTTAASVTTTTTD
jgi:cytochrome c-type biogenesis protein CcmH/NrfG